MRPFRLKLVQVLAVWFENEVCVHIVRGRRLLTRCFEQIVNEDAEDGEADDAGDECCKEHEECG